MVIVVNIFLFLSITILEDIEDIFGDNVDLGILVDDGVCDIFVEVDDADLSKVGINDGAGFNDGNMECD